MPKPVQLLRRTHIPLGVRAFTLIELLVVIGVVGILIALTVPALRSIRGEALSTKSLANTRSIFILFELHADRHKGQYPFADSKVSYPGACPGQLMSYFSWHTTYGWPSVIADIMPWSEGKMIFLSPRARREEQKIGNVTATTCGSPTSYHFSQSFLARPEIWGASPPADFSALVAPTFQSDVVYPSRKVMIWDWELPYVPRKIKLNASGELDERTPTLFADGHGDQKVQSQGTEAVSSVFANSWSPIQRWHNTKDGVRGWDF